MSIPINAKLVPATRDGDGNLNKIIHTQDIETDGESSLSSLLSSLVSRIEALEKEIKDIDFYFDAETGKLTLQRSKTKRIALKGVPFPKQALFYGGYQASQDATTIRVSTFHSEIEEVNSGNVFEFSISNNTGGNAYAFFLVPSIYDIDAIFISEVDRTSDFVKTDNAVSISGISYHAYRFETAQSEHGTLEFTARIGSRS